MSLAITYRPATLKEVHGNEELKKSLTTILKRDPKDIPHAFLLSGISGGGKTTIARIIGKHLKCHEQEFYEINSADFRGIDSIRDLIKQSRYAPMNGNARVWLIDETHKLTNDAQNAMLKMLEDAPNHCYYILATTDPQKLITTVKNRCTTFEVKPLDEEEMVTLLQYICEEEEKEVPEEILEKIAKNSNGSSRAAIQVLERVIDLPVKEMKAAAEQMEEFESQTIDLCRALLNKKTSWKEIAKILTGLQADPEQIRYAVLGYCNAILLKGDNPRAFLIIDSFKDAFYSSGKVGVTWACYSVVMGE